MTQFDLFSNEGNSLFKACLQKMKVSIENDKVNYILKQGDSTVSMNELIGKDIYVKFEGKIICTSCGKKTKKSFGQGFCYPCFTEAPEASECIIHPELCKAHLGEGRDPEWEKANHARPHYVYLAVSSAVKVGITRADQIPVRWIDQGASYAIRIAETPYRQLAGVIEVALKDRFTDKTNWRSMLKNEVLEDIDLVESKWALEEILPSDLLEYMSDNDEVIHLNYPVEKWPEKVKSISLDKVGYFSGLLSGIKGQYLIFNDGHVMNIRNHTAYEVELGVCG